MDVDKNKAYNEVFDCSPFTLATILDPNASASTGQTPLHWASEYSNSDSSLETVEALLKNGADPNAQDNDGQTPLHSASYLYTASRYSGNTIIPLKIVEALLRSGAKPNIKHNGGWTPLHYVSAHSIEDSSLKIVDVLLKNGADPNVKDNNNKTPLHYLLLYVNKNTSMEIVKLLLRYNATPINELTTKLKLEIDIENLVEENKKLRSNILSLESEED